MVKHKYMKALIITIILLTQSVFAFCGIYVSEADADLYNESSKVIIARDGKRTVLTIANNFRGNVKEFAMLVPVPTMLGQNQVQVGFPEIVEKIDAYSAPRLVEYSDSDPCKVAHSFTTPEVQVNVSDADSTPISTNEMLKTQALGINIEDAFRVGEYDIVVINATQPSDLERWLIEHGYRIPEGATALFEAYIAQGMKFLVASVNLRAFELKDTVSLRPIMMAFETDNLVLPIQLGMMNANGKQDLTVYFLSSEGQAQVSNYRNVRVPTDINLPEYIEDDFRNFYTSMFRNTVEREGSSVVITEFVGDVKSCNSCITTPFSDQELEQAGVFWLPNMRSYDEQGRPQFLIAGGLSCFDRNRNNIKDLEEDINGDGVVNSYDCNGSPNTPGRNCSAGPEGPLPAGVAPKVGASVCNPEVPYFVGKPNIGEVNFPLINIYPLIAPFVPYCYDLNRNGLEDFQEDLNGDGIFNRRDCIGVVPFMPIPEDELIPVNVYLTRLHLHYDSMTHPQDLHFEIDNTYESFQAKYNFRKPFRNDMVCDESNDYNLHVVNRQQSEIEHLASLTGWSFEDIRLEIINSSLGR